MIDNDSQQNKDMLLARQYIEYTHQSIFLTGRAGTGKTTFLRQLQQDKPKRMVVVAPTGVAAINAQSVTIHSLFQIAPGLHAPGQRSKEKGRFKMSDRKRKLLRTLDLLVIDEISMVRCDLLDAIDDVLKHYKQNKLPFGGVQLLLIGDLQQLAPVAKEDEWEILKNFYDTPYFFSSKALQQVNYTTIELKHIYRQKDEAFINILAQVRTNSLTQESISKLNQRYIPKFVPSDSGDWIRLTTHNNSANKYNQEKLEELPTSKKSFQAVVKGNFPETSFPADENLVLKVGAQVMFIKNDPSMAHQYYNGKIGKITEFSENGVVVKCLEDDSPISVTPVSWENMKYKLNEKTGEIQDTIDGTFTQIPLRLAWSITIHKSQGLTFNHAVLDVNQSFAHGQTYVALSRCRTLEGLVLSRPISSSSIICDKNVDNYVNYELERSQQSESELDLKKRDYFVFLLDEMFDFSLIHNALEGILELVKHYTPLASTPYTDKVIEAIKTHQEKIVNVSRAFRNQYLRLIAEATDYDNDKPLQERIKAAANYFYTELSTLTSNFLIDSVVSISNQNVKERFQAQIQNLNEIANFKTCVLAYATLQDTNIKSYLNSKANAELKKDPFAEEEPEEKKEGKKKEKKESEKKRKKGDSLRETYELYNQGLSIKEIAKKREFATTTIESHIAQLVGNGEIDIDDVVSENHQIVIGSVISEFEEDAKLSEIKEELGKEYSYFEIKCMLEYQKRINKT